ncbi:DUF933 domain-containing protein [Candidatus Mycoplasma haematominutum]|uniref:GTP-binding and nucleic acid-binding protein YchF n=1 Tax=Candidatus Mycoplasma haematominutum 'Birmingham 1' TaxID=1116213 RepID=G8C2K2_9MOLU|nr:DUF933 domain-containing protein [Candidatus Mycoplasma haematominutum]CCE66550.1 GTP-binding and nucleic acid-binding protein YchF [Candidatus Mycoplasma haematominutum 'Birmingham 1']
MIYKIGLVGLPNVGKSSLFNLLSSSAKSVAAPFPFSTIQPTKVVINFPDITLNNLYSQLLYWFPNLEYSKLIKKECKFELIDLAGIVPVDGVDSEKKSELGPSFLSYIRGVDLILLVVRTFTNDSVESQLKTFLEEHTELSSYLSYSDTSKVKSESIFELKLVLMTLIHSDLELISKLITKYSKDKLVFEKELNLLLSIKKELEERKYIPIYLLSRYKKSTDWEKQLLDRLSLLTTKKTVVLSNYGSSKESLKKLSELKKWTKNNSLSFSALNIEGEELHNLSNNTEEKESLRNSEYLRDSSILELLKTIVQTLGLNIFYTFKLEDKNKKKYSLSNFSWTLEPTGGEVRAWFFVTSENLARSAARIHNDLSNYFVSSKIVESEKFLKLEKGQNFTNLLSSVSKTYQLRGGEIVQIISSV